jgi:hypothetical protein
VRHAGPDALDALEDLLAAIRAHAALSERKRGTFYRKSAAFLHFHEDPEGLFADLKCGGDWERFRVSDAKERAAFLREVGRALSPKAAATRGPSRGTRRAG